jgi:hypothetical protein
MIARVPALGLALVLAACAGVSPPTQFYALAPVQPPAEAADPARPPTIGVGPIGVGPIGVAEYLRRPQIVTRESRTRLRLADFDQWIEPFDVLFPRVLAQDLAALLGTDRVSLYPPPRDVRLDFAVEVDVIRFDGEPETGIVLDALWRIYGRDGDRLLDQGRARVERPVPKPDEPGLGAPTIDYPAIVQAMSEATGDLARIVADSILAQGTRR